MFCLSVKRPSNYISLWTVIDDSTMDTEFLSSLSFILSGVHKVESQMTVLSQLQGPQQPPFFCLLGGCGPCKLWGVSRMYVALVMKRKEIRNLQGHIHSGNAPQRRSEKEIAVSFLLLCGHRATHTLCGPTGIKKKRNINRSTLYEK